MLWGAFFYQRIFPIGHKITGYGGMYPTLRSGDYIVVRGPDVLTRGDVITYQLLEEKYRSFFAEKGDTTAFKKLQVGRVIGLPTETITINRDRVFINGSLIIEPYVEKKDSSLVQLETIIPIGYFFVLKDNRNIGIDSRHFGPIAKEQISEKVINIYRPAGLKSKGWLEFITGGLILLGFIVTPYFQYKRTPQTRLLKFLLLYHSSIVIIFTIGLLGKSFDKYDPVNPFPIWMLPLTFYPLMLAWLEFVFFKSWIAVVLTGAFGWLGGVLTFVEIKNKLAKA